MLKLERITTRRSVNSSTGFGWCACGADIGSELLWGWGVVGMRLPRVSKTLEGSSAIPQQSSISLSPLLSSLLSAVASSLGAAGLLQHLPLSTGELGAVDLSAVDSAKSTPDLVPHRLLPLYAPPYPPQNTPGCLSKIISTMVSYCSSRSYVT